MLDRLLAGSKAAGRTVMFASHEHERAEVIADRVVYLAGGRVVEAPEAPRPPVTGAATHVA
jgi:ABC-type Na+ transport system ATPase subunit NatA